MQRCHEMRAGACVKERSEQRWRRQCVRLQGGGAAVQQACLSAAWHGEVRRRASMGPAHLAWMWVGSRCVDRSDVTEESQTPEFSTRHEPATGGLQRYLRSDAPTYSKLRG